MDIKVGHIYKLNAPWHRRHMSRTLVVHMRDGVSPEYLGRPIYHIVDNDDFSGEPDWDTEYVADNFIEIEELDMSELVRRMRGGHDGQTDGFFNEDSLYGKHFKGMGRMRHVTEIKWIVFFMPRPDEDNFLFGDSGGLPWYAFIITERDNIFRILKDDEFVQPQLISLMDYYDDELNFIAQQPTN